MKRVEKAISAALACAAVLCFISPPVKAADVLTPCLLKLSIYTNLPGSAVSDFTSDPTYPASPGEVRYLHSFNTRDAAPTDALQDFGGRIEGILTPQESGDYYFFLSSDEQSQLWLSSDDTEGGAIMIAEETRRGHPFLEPDDAPPTTSTPIQLTAGKHYFIMVLYKGSSGEGNDTDFAKVAWRKVGDTTPAASLKPIRPAFLSTYADPAKAPKFNITQQPKDVTAEENSRATFSVAIDLPVTNYFCIQWQRNGVSIPGAEGTNYTRFMDKTDNGVKFRALIAVPGASVNSSEVTATVTADNTRPAIVSAKGGHNRPEVYLTFSERVSQASATTPSNYKIANPSGTALAVTDAILSADLTQVTLKTDPQVVGTEYTVTVNNVADLAAAGANTIAANTPVKFVAVGPLLQGIDGFVVWEAEDYDRNLDGLWFADTERGVASGGVSMVSPPGVGGDENTSQLEYDVVFTKTGTHIIWYRASGNDGGSDSAWLHIDGQRPADRTSGSTGAMNGFDTSLQSTYSWASEPNEGSGQMTFVIDTPGLHAIGVGVREAGSFFDKFVITTDPNFSPTTGFGPMGPGVTLRQGELAAPGASVQITANPVSTNGLENTSITLSAAAALPPGYLFSYLWQRKQGNAFVDIPGTTSTNFTLNPLTMDWNGAVVRMRVTAGGDVKYTDEATITVTPETIVPQVVRVTGSALQPQAVIVFSEPVTVASGQSTANYRVASESGTSLAVQSATVSGGGRIVVLATGPQTVGTKYTVTINGVADTAAKPNVMSNVQAKFFSLGALQPQGADGLLVWEAENFDRNLDDLWVINTTRGVPSGGASMVVPTGGSETATQLEYDLTFTKTGTNIVWFRASGPDGSSDSGWLWLDGARPPNRTTGNQASMTGFSGQTDFVWLSNPQDGGGQFTININTAGQHKLSLCRRENNAHFDKFLITTDPNFNPLDYGPFGPPETRAGEPPLPSVTMTGPTAQTKFPEGANVDLKVQIAATGRTVSKVEYFDGATKIGEATAAPFSYTWQKAPTGVHNVMALLTDDVGDSARSGRVLFVVGEPNEVLFLVGNTDLALPANAGDAAIRDHLASLGFRVVVVDDTASQASDALGRKVVINSASVDSTQVGTKFRDVTVPVINWEQADQDDFGMTGDTAMDHGIATNQTQIALLDDPLVAAAGFKAGPLTVATAPMDISWGRPSANATRIATVVGNPDQVAIYGYDTGDKMFNDFAAPAPRVELFLTETSVPSLNADAIKLFDAALAWAAKVTVGPPAGSSLSVARTPTGLTLTFKGTLQSADSVLGPWNDVPNSASPLVVTPAGTGKFYRSKQ